MDPKYIFALICFVSSSSANGNYNNYSDIPRKRYDGYSVLRIIPDSKEKLKFVQNLRNNVQLDVWNEFGIINKPIDIMIPPQRLQEIRERLNIKKISHSVWVQDVQSLIDKESQRLKRHENLFRQTSSLSSFFENYWNSGKIYEYLNLLKNHYPSLIEIEDVGTTFYNRTLKLVKITMKSTSNKPIIWIDGGIHAREWITPATAIYFIYKLLSENDKNDDIKKLLTTYDWYIMPLVNPDGYDYTFGRDRFWRKNLSKSPVHQEGVDLNRNFPFGWNNSLTTPRDRNPESITYIGPSALSEKETQAIARILNNVQDKMKLFVTLHSFSQLILFPWGYIERDISDYSLLKNIGMRAAEKIKTYAGTEYIAESIVRILYTCPGNSLDWTYGKLGVKYSFAFELRDRGKEGFDLSRDQIIPVGEETWLGIKSIISDIQVRDGL